MSSDLTFPDFRVIPNLYIKNNSLVQGINLEGLRVLGEPEVFAKLYYENGADELIYHDVVASLYGQNTLFEIVEKTAKKIFIPLTVGGGIRSVEQIKKILSCGADKISLNSAAVKNPKFITECAQIFGTSTISINIQTNKINDEYYVFTETGRNNSGKKLIDWMEQVQSYGAGEIVLTSILKEGTGKGVDTELLKNLQSNIHIPLIIQGGIGDINTVINLKNDDRFSGAAISSALHYYYLTKIKNSVQSFGNKDFIMGLREQNDRKQFSLADLKKKLNNFVKKVGIINCSTNNLFSINNIIKELGYSTIVSDDKKDLERCDYLILPGVGAFFSKQKKN